MFDKLPAFRISFVGDVMGGNSCYQTGRGIASQYLKHRGVPWVPFLSRLFKGTDEVYGNLESPFTENEAHSVAQTFLGCADFLSFLKRCGFTGMNVANNHILESGPTGFYETLNLLQRTGLAPVGYLNDETPSVVKIAKQGITLGIAGFNAIHDIQNPGCYCSLSADNVRYALTEMKDLDFRVLILHWGTEYMPYPSPKQILQAHEFIDWGADVIVGHHPHVVQPMERYKHGVIFYSLGNFIFDFNFSPSVRFGAVANVELRKGMAPVYSLVPVYRALCYTFHHVNRDEFRRKLQNRLACAKGLLPNDDEQKYARRALRVSLIYRVMMLIHNLRDFTRFDRHSKELFLKRLLSKLPPSIAQ